MNLPLFTPGADPGPSFMGLIEKTGPSFNQLRPAAAMETERNVLSGIPHGTTIIAVRYAAGVVIAGDRRATEGVSIAHRSIEKVFPADKFSAVAIAGAAGPAIEMVKLFQTQLEHYEKTSRVISRCLISKVPGNLLDRIADIGRYEKGRCRRWIPTQTLGSRYSIFGF